MSKIKDLAVKYNTNVLEAFVAGREFAEELVKVLREFVPDIAYSVGGSEERGFETICFYSTIRSQYRTTDYDVELCTLNTVLSDVFRRIFKRDWFFRFEGHAVVLTDKEANALMFRLNALLSEEE